MICYLRDMFGKKIEQYPYTLKGPIAIFLNDGNKARCPAWGSGKEIIKFDENNIYVKSDVAGKIDVFDETGVKVKEIDVKDLG